MILFKDIRQLQILVMLGLLLTGVILKDFTIMPIQVVLTFISGIFAQFLWMRALRIKELSFLSTLITCFGVSLLLRADALWVHPLAISLAISSKFTIRYQNKHIFNPAAFGVLFAILFFKRAWISPGQWGFTFSLALTLSLWGIFLTYRAKRLGISLKFIVFYVLLILLRDHWLGWELDVTLHKICNGSLLLFTFFMISDPRTSANHSNGQTLQAFLVAILSFYFHYFLYWNNAFIYALIFITPITLISNQIWQARDFSWTSLIRGNNENILTRPY